MPECRLCNRKTPRSRLIDQVCTDCRMQQGLATAGEPLRPRVPCRGCNGTSFVRSHALRERTVGVQMRPLGLTYQLAPYQAFWERPSKKPLPDAPIGLLETYACRACGLTEMYTRNAGQVPIGPEYGTELFEIDRSGPYR